MEKMKDSGIEWIGEIPEDWKIIRNKYCVEFYNGDRSDKYPKPNDLVDEGIPFLSSREIENDYVDISNSKFITLSKYKSLSGAKITIGDIIYCLRGSIGKCAINNFLNEGTVASSLTVIRPKIINSKYLLYILLSDISKSQTDLYMNGTCAANLSAENLGEYDIPLPPIKKQNRIAAFLDSKCATIASLKNDIEKQIETLEQYKKSVITEAVTKGINPDVKMKNSGIEWIGKIPEHWEIHPIYYYFEERKHKNSLCKEQNLLSLSYGNIIRKDINALGGLLPESFNTYNIIEKDDIVIRPTDLQNDKRSLRTGLCKEHGIITSAYITLMPKKNVNSQYFHYLLHSYDIEKVFYNMGNGVRQGLNYSEFKKLLVISPTFDEQKNIVEYLDSKCLSIDNIINSKKQQLEKLEEYKKSLIFEYVTGKREV